ncbi:outer membrane protein assembly factor BamB family protein [Streptomyces sp. NBC_00576]|uniref:outer membrane protein assembly factor BamB family protein n=1 Tax=Streptomyces sp. NBC_00576 TaxID=2903665 RepID=UPI002E80F107|nr:PQQ-binding-like beta-propeller repeat protein [Streptomyces sp. NBC_00576]WUB72608.1 PQQ-like beta-propeller repeat protein [Streptomyces sp. NBC_00576]
MTTEQVEEKVRETLHAVALDRVRAPGDLAEKVLRRRSRRRFSQAAGVVTAVAAITVGAVFGFGGGGAAEQHRPVRPASAPDGWKAWESGDPGASERGCLVDGAALYCAGSEFDAAKTDANTGKRLWTVKVNREGDGFDHPFAVRDGVVYAYRNHTSQNLPNGDYDGGTDLMAVDAGDGRLLWAVEMPQGDRSDQAAMLIDGAVLANTPSLRTMSALDPLTGKEKWHYTWDKGIACQRAVLSDVPYLLCTSDAEKPDDSRTDTDLFRLDPATGSAKKVTTVPGRQGLIGASEDRMVLIEAKDVLSDDKKLTTVSGSGQQTSHRYRVEGTTLAASEVVGDRLISVSRQGRASVYSLTTGRTLWTRPVGVEMPDQDAMQGIASPVVSAGQGVVYFFSPTGDLSGLDLRTGEQVWDGHVDTGSTGPDFGDSAQLLLYKDVLIARSGSRIDSLLPRISD